MSKGRVHYGHNYLPWCRKIGLKKPVKNTLKDSEVTCLKCIKARGPK